MTAAPLLRSNQTTTALSTRPPVDDACLVDRAKAGDYAAFEMLVSRYERRIHALTYQMLDNSEDADDVTQETFLRAYRNLGRTNNQLNFSAWLHRIAANACLDQLRRRCRIHWLPWDVEQHEHILGSSPSDDPELVVLDSERRSDVQQVLAAMRPNYRLGLILREYEGMTTREIGAVMGLTVPAVKSLLFRAREDFRQLYRDAHERPLRA
jgi:RNA polymerase sigma-70 factor (ECF subfamily)